MSTKKEAKVETLSTNKKIALFSVLGFVLGILVAIIFVFADYQYYLRSCDNDPCNNPHVACIQACQHRSMLFGKDRPFDPATTKFYYF